MTSSQRSKRNKARLRLLRLAATFHRRQGDDRAVEHTAMTDRVIHPPTSDADHLTAVRDEIDTLLEQQPPYVVVGADGNHIELPASALEALRKVVEAMSRGESVTVIPHDKQLTSQEAAEILSVSRPHLIKLLDRGELPFHRVGTHRRIKIEDVLAYRERRDAERRAALAELTRLSEDLPGGYR
jgi:excisionase family DNA binding protein